MKNSNFWLMIIAFALSLILLNSCNKLNVAITLPTCDKCGNTECIYEDIDTMSDGTDQSTFDAIIYFSKERNLTEEQIQILFNEYYL